MSNPAQSRPTAPPSAAAKKTVRTFAQFLETAPPDVAEEVTDRIRYNNSGAGPYLSEPILQLHCEQCGGIRSFYCTSSDAYLSDEINFEYQTYACRNCRAAVPGLDELRHHASNWGESEADHELVVGTADGEVSFEIKFTLPRYFEEDHPGQSLVTYAAFLRCNDLLMDSAARLRGYPSLDSWRYLENEIVRQAIAWKLLKPTKATIDKYPDLRGTWSVEDYVQDDTENALILKTGGAEIGASIYNFGTNASGSTRLSGNWGNTITHANKDRKGHGEAQTGSDSWIGDDDAGSFDPD
jgi:hypothetical protein